MKKLIINLLAIFLCYTFVVAQEKKRQEPYNNWEIGINAGVASFTGEYNMFKDARFNHFNHWKSEMNLGFGATAKKNFSHVFGLEAMWNYSNLTGSWKYDARPLADFKTEVNEYNLNTVWNLTNLRSQNKFERKVYWYAKVGIGASHLWKKAGANSLNDEHWKLPTIPMGTGISMRLTDRMQLSLGTLWSWVNTDRLDGRRTDMISGNFKPGYSESDIFGTKLYTHVGLSFVFGKKKRKKPEPIVEIPISEHKREPKPEPTPQIQTGHSNNEKPSVIGNAYKVYFAFDKWDLDRQGIANLEKLAKDMIDNPSVEVEIKSYTDSRGPASYNMKLSEKRGKSVIDYLVSKGVNASRINAHAFGESQPINKCTDGVECSDAEHALNRRTETIVID
jgi:outer membrane protein OmpA-like peptidoglycan-associated protein